MTVLRMFFVGAVASVGTISADAADWPRFRGPNGSGVSHDQQPLPTSWSETENLAWSVELPGPGSSCPIVVGNKVLVTCWTGYGVDRDDIGQQENLKRVLACYDRTSGEQIWAESVDAALPEDSYGGMFAEHGYASHTPASDGERVYAFFGKSGVVAFDLDGNKLWQTSVGDGLDPHRWGSACSPVLYKNLVIIPAIAESEALIALDKTTGDEVWREPAGGFAATWGTPILVKVDDERTDLVLAVPYEVWGFNPDTGKLRWAANGIDSNSMCASVVGHGAEVFLIGGREGGALAIRAGGKGEVTDTHTVWQGRQTGRIGTPLYHGGRLHWIASGVANCIDAESGEPIYKNRLQAGAGGDQPEANPVGRRRGGRGQDYSSPVAGDGRLYYVSRRGDMYVLALGPEFKRLAVNRFAGDDGDFSASPAISDGQILIRSSKKLYCVAEQQAPQIN